jgi:vacuolar-type H+-ATPase subunit E/Vma4
MTVTAPAHAALEPVRLRLLRDAEAQAAAVRQAARAQAAQILSEAHREAVAAASAAAAGAQVTAAPLRAAELRRARERARSAILGAQRQARDDLHQRVLDAVTSLPGQPGYDRLIHRITELAEQAAGPNARVTIAPEGGVVARSGSVVVDCSLSRLADLAVAGLGAAIRELWTT